MKSFSRGDSLPLHQAGCAHLVPHQDDSDR